jgi:hypothetical protein
MTNEEQLAQDCARWKKELEAELSPTQYSKLVCIEAQAYSDGLNRGAKIVKEVYSNGNP